MASRGKMGKFTEGLTTERTEKIKEPRTRTKQINTTDLTNQKVQQHQNQQAQLQHQQQQSGRDGVERRVRVKGEISQ